MATNPWLNAGWRVLAILVILIGGYQALLLIRRDSTSNEIGRRILAIAIQEGEPDSVKKLLAIAEKPKSAFRDGGGVSES